MEQKRAKKNKKFNRISRLKKRRKRTRRIILLMTIIILLLFSGIIFNNVYVTSKCTSLEYAVDYYFTKWDNKNLRLLNVQTMSLVDKNGDHATVEAYGLSYLEPRERTTLIGEFVKGDNGSWSMQNVENKNSLTSNE